MAIEVIKTGNGSWPGHVSNIGSYSVSEASTPLNPADSSGATGTMKFGTIDDPNSSVNAILLLNDVIELVDSGQGRTKGTVSSVSADNGLINVGGNSRLNLLVARVKAAPFSGTLGNAFAYYLSLVGITSGFAVDGSITSRSFVSQGWYDDLWLKLKEMCSVYNVEISLVSSNIILRPLRTRTAELMKVGSQSWEVANNELALRTAVVYYNNTLKTNGLVYPTSIYDEGQILQGSAGENRVYSFPIKSTLTSLNQPVPTVGVGKFYAGPLSVYSVIDQSEQDVTQWWLNNGGSIRVSQRDDYSAVLDITVYAPRSGTTGPYSIAAIDSSGEKYSTLKITGTGVFFDPQTIVGATGADLARTARDIGATVDNINISTPADAYAALAKAGGAYAGADQTVTMKATVINRVGDSGQMQYATFEDFNTNNSGRTFAQFNTAFNGQTFDQFNEYYDNLVADTFANQAFGNVAGARVRFRDAQYRIRSADIDPLGVNFTAEKDTLFDDFNTVNSGLTFAQFNTRWTGKTFDDMATIPLWGG